MRSTSTKQIRLLTHNGLRLTGPTSALVLAIVSISISGCLNGPFQSGGMIPANTAWPSQQPTANTTPFVNVEMPNANANANSGQRILNQQTTTIQSNSDQGFTTGQPATGFIPNSPHNPSGGSQSGYYGNTRPASQSSGTQTFFRGQSPQDGGVQRASYQYPELQNGAGRDPNFSSTISTGSPNELNPLVPRFTPGGVGNSPDNIGLNYTDIDVYVSETQTGRINFGGAYNSDNGIVGQFVIDERNFDILRFPRNFGEVFDGTAWRGAGQGFRLELVPGRDVQRYLVNFSEPYLLNTPVSFSASAYLFDRRYFDWDEQRLGGRIALGYRIDHDLSISAGIRAENVDIRNPRVATSAQLNSTVGETDLFVGHVGLIRDTRDHPFLATEGSYLSATYSIGFGENDFGRGDIEYRRYMLMYERPDGSGRHTVSMSTRLGFTGSETPIFENYHAGGFSTMRGYDFRGASPVEGGVRVGGEFQWLNTLEYMFPLTSSDMVKGVVFCDFGTVEEEIDLNSDNFRVAPGFGFRVHMPAAGIGAPLAFDFAFPVSSADTDEEKMFSFYLGVLR